LNRILILGAGAQGQCIANAVNLAARAGQPITAIGYLDDKSELWNKKALGLPVFGPLNIIGKIQHDEVIIGIGDNNRRYQLFQEIEAEGFRFAALIHPTALIASNVEIGKGTFISGYVILDVGVTIGANCIIHGSSLVGHHSIIDDHVHFAPGVHTGGQVRVGKGTLIGIGANVLPGCSVGRWAVVGGGALVNKNIPDNIRVAGVPAKTLAR